MKSKLGQNFLIDESVAEREVRYANIVKNDVVLEIGPGKGILTKKLAEKAKKVIAIEIDKKLFDSLEKQMPDNVELIHDDALEIDFEDLLKFNKIVANLPFQISSPITFKILDYDFELAVLIYQKEFADRLIAKPRSKDYSRLTVNTYYKANCELLEIIPSNCFEPQPKVDSSIIKMIKRKKHPFSVLNEESFFRLVKILFNNRRKKIKNILKTDIENVPFLNNRVEELSPCQIGELSNHLFSEKIKIN
ncbi:MAG TPA: ribosomal RNA small subunit methyltransferase A [Bacteroidetes bacterium]|nr:ribosomal RNA small subunit methyltransferase A [Bacteroidota bacterium]